ncbi:MAG: TlpA family protein disulfide reductase [Daejeonella sp.]|nr:TlpA family protein disulfide reductase [Daejeonella sp.]
MNIQSIYCILVFTIFFMITACSGPDKKELTNGIWRATLKTQSSVEIPFNFEVIDSVGKKVIKIINSTDRFLIDDVSFQDDSVVIHIPLFNSEIRAIVKDNSLSGDWIKHLANKDVRMKFDATANTKWRFFKTDSSSRINVEGKWSTLFIKSDATDTTVAIGNFIQNKSYISGTFLTPTGDYRFLEGTVSDHNIYLSGFDGSSAMLFTGKLKNDSIITNGKYYSGYSSIKNWQARKDKNAILPDAYALTSLKSGIKKINFSFPDLNNKKVSNNDSKFKNKVVIIQFLGSWCPNCMDETAYLCEFYKTNKKRDIEIIGLAYERTTDLEKSKRAVTNLKNRFHVPYDILLTGFTNNTKEVVKSIPELNSFMAFPTTLIIDKHGVVRKIHTGFSGPGTGEYYKDFVNEFEQTIKNLLAEN